MAGDFNSILSSNDRINNGLFNSVGNLDFIDCISSSNLMEPDFTANYFTWRGGENFSIHSKIDRVFVNNLWMDVFHQFGFNFGNHLIGDHVPINIRFMLQDSKKIRKPFRYSNSWHLQPGYQSSLYEAMTKEFQGNPLHVLLCRLKSAKNALKTWRKNKSNIHKVIEQIKEEANQIYIQLVTNPLNENLIQLYTSKNAQIQSIMRKIAVENEQQLKIN